MILDARQHETTAGCSGSCDEETPVDESARIRSGRKLLQQVRAIHSRYNVPHKGGRYFGEGGAVPAEGRGRAANCPWPIQRELFNVLFSVGNYQLLLAKPVVLMLRGNSDKKHKNRKGAVQIKWKGVMQRQKTWSWDHPRSFSPVYCQVSQKCKPVTFRKVSRSRKPEM
jgi:hypothetical protein